MDGQPASSDGQDAVAALRARLAVARPGRLTDAIRLMVERAAAVIDELQLDAAELDAFLQFLTDVGYATDARRQEWVLLADVFGLSDLVMNRAAPRDPGATPATLPGPFYRPDAPLLALGANLCRNGIGVPLSVSGRVLAADGEPVACALVEVWHADGTGRYENQDPDNQPEHNLRGRFHADAGGSFHFRTVRPGGYALPGDGPVGQLVQRLGLSLDRPAHIHFAVTAPGFRPLVTAIFDRHDPAIDRDALFAVRPALISAFGSGSGDPGGRRDVLEVSLVLDQTQASAARTQSNTFKKG